MTSLRFEPSAGGAKRHIGRIEIESLNDGVLNADPEVVLDSDPNVQRLAQDQSSGALLIPVNVFLLRHPDGLALVDAGAGLFGGPGAGRVPRELASRGISLGDIKFVLMTHLHPDHVGGLLGPSGEAMFDQARIVVTSKELSFWTETDLEAPMTDRLRRNMVNVRRALKPYAERMLPLEELELSGISSVQLPGHTPGHAGWLVENNDRRILLWGDIVHFVELQLAFPDVALAYDVDAPAAAATRRKTFGLVMELNLEVGGAHLPFPGFGKLVIDTADGGSAFFDGASSTF